MIVDVMIVIVCWVLWVVLLGVFVLILVVCVCVGLSMFGVLGIYVLVECLFYVMVILVMLVVVVIWGGEMWWWFVFVLVFV